MKSILLPIIGSFVFLLLATIPFVHSKFNFDNADSSGTLDESYVYDYYDLSNSNKNENDKDKAAQVNIQSQLAQGSMESTTVVTTKAKSTNYDDYYDYDESYDTNNYNYDNYNSNSLDQNSVIEGHQFIDPKPKVDDGNKETNAFEPETSTRALTTKSARSKLLAIMAKPGILAGIVGGAIIGVLTAILLIMFIVYRMKKKDEGSYALEETKKPLNSYDYRHCPTKEFYA